MTNKISILGAFFVDLACRTDRMPEWGETLHGLNFTLGPGGKGSNQAVAAARHGADVDFITRVGNDSFGTMARQLYLKEKIGTEFVFTDDTLHTGTATIIVRNDTAENSIIIVPGACDGISLEHIDSASLLIRNSSIFVSQLELDIKICRKAIEIAYHANVPVLLNPAPAFNLDNDLYPMITYLTPNEKEAEKLSGHPVRDINETKIAANLLRSKGVKNVIITLGEKGVYVDSETFTGFIPAYNVAPPIDTTGAGDAFNGAFAAAISQGVHIKDAAYLGCISAGISVTRIGTTPSMPYRNEVNKYLGDNL